MVKATMDIRAKAVVLYSEGIKTAIEIGQLYNISDRTVRRWNQRFEERGVEGLKPSSTAPKRPSKQTPKRIINRVISLKRKYPAWGARRLKFQFGIPLHYTAVHEILKRHGLIFKIKAKPQPCKRFQRKHVDSMWQGDTFEFRIHGVGKVYVTGFSDDCSRYRIRSKAYLKKGAEQAVNCLRWGVRNGRIPREMYLDNGKQFTSKLFKQEAAKHGIKLIFGRPYNARGRGKIEKYHGALYQELICRKYFKSLSHFRRELWKFDQKYNNWRKQEILGWQTPAQIYFDKRYFNKQKQKVKKRTNVRLTKADIC